MAVSKRTRRRGGRVTTAAALAMALSAASVACTSSGAQDAPENADASGSAGPSASPTPQWDRSPASIAALGDSITTGFDTCSLLKDCPEASWATGTDTAVDSLAQRLLPSNGKTWNYAVSGADMSDLPDQAAQAVAHRPELVTVLIGANDACSDEVGGMTPVKRFRADFTKAMDTVREESPKTQVYVSSVPDLKRLWSEGRKSRLASQVWRLGICQSMLKDPQATDAASGKRRDQVAERVAEYNTVLREVCAADPRCRYDDGAVHAYGFTTDELSRWDLFHPSKRGQHILARLAYQGITAA